MIRTHAVVRWTAPYSASQIATARQASSAACDRVTCACVEQLRQVGQTPRGLIMAKPSLFLDVHSAWRNSGSASNSSFCAEKLRVSQILQASLRVGAVRPERRFVVFHGSVGQRLCLRQLLLPLQQKYGPEIVPALRRFRCGARLASFRGSRAPFRRGASPRAASSAPWKRSPLGEALNRFGGPAPAHAPESPARERAARLGQLPLLDSHMAARSLRL